MKGCISELWIWDIIKSWWAVIVFGFIFINGLYIAENVKWGNNFDTYNTIGVSATVAISFLAFVAYIQFSTNQHKKTKYIKWLNNLSTKDRQASLMIHFGGTGASPKKDMKDFAKNELNIADDHIEFKSFGKDNVVSRDDIDELKSFIVEFQSKYGHVDEVSIFIKGASPAYAVCADMLSNWKTLKFYHFQNGYELWYASDKHTPKDTGTIGDNQIS